MQSNLLKYLTRLLMAGFGMVKQYLNPPLLNLHPLHHPQQKKNSLPNSKHFRRRSTDWNNQ